MIIIVKSGEAESTDFVGYVQRLREYGAKVIIQQNQVIKCLSFSYFTINLRLKERVRQKCLRQGIKLVPSRDYIC
jgi:hypothetical protein